MLPYAVYRILKKIWRSSRLYPEKMDKQLKFPSDNPKYLSLKMQKMNEEEKKTQELYLNRLQSAREIYRFTERMLDV